MSPFVRPRLGRPRAMFSALIGLAVVGTAAVLMLSPWGDLEEVQPWPEMDGMRLIRNQLGLLRPMDPTPERIASLPRDPEEAAKEVARRLAVRECGDPHFDSVGNDEGGRYFVPSCNPPSTVEDGSRWVNPGWHVAVEAAPVLYKGNRQFCLINVLARSTNNLCLADRWYREAPAR